MLLFSKLATRIANTTKTNDKRAALVKYLEEASDEDKIWLIALFTGRRPKRLVTSTLMRQWCREETAIQEWLFNESYQQVGDLAEAIALLLPMHIKDISAEAYSLNEMMLRLKALYGAEEVDKKNFILQQWRSMPQDACLVFNKLVLGGFRIGVSQALIIQALAIFLDKDPQAVAHLISGSWDGYNTTFKSLFHESDIEVDDSKLYPFYLAYPIEGEVSNLGSKEEWQVEWKWDGIRGQLIRRKGALYLWSRGEELMTEKFPEIQELQPVLPDGLVLDGEILSYRDGQPLSFQYLQTRIGRKTVSKKQLLEAPTVFMAYDVLEYNGEDYRQRPQSERRIILEKLLEEIHHPNLLLSELVQFKEWDDLHQLILTARERACEGYMIKRKDAIYQAGRRRGDWWKWKVEPLTIDAVMLYAQKGHGKRSGLYTDYTFAVRDGDKLVTFAKAYSGLTDKEIAEVDKWVKANGKETFGPVRTVKPELVFEIGFEGIGESSRHKSGVAVRFPRMLRWRKDKSPEDANTLDDLKEMLAMYGKV